MPGGWLTSKPTCWKTFGCSSASAFFVLVSRNCCNDQGKTLVSLRKGRYIMYIGGGLLTLVVIIILVMFFMRH